MPRIPQFKDLDDHTNATIDGLGANDVGDQIQSMGLDSGSDYLLGDLGFFVDSANQTLGDFAANSEFSEGYLSTQAYAQLMNNGVESQADFIVLGRGDDSANPFYIYDSATGRLYYDEDGSYTSASPELIATLIGKADLDAVDLVVPFPI